MQFYSCCSQSLRYIVMGPIPFHGKGEPERNQLAPVALGELLDVGRVLKKPVCLPQVQKAQSGL